MAAAIGDDVDVLVNCAGGWSPSGVTYADASAQQWDAVLTLNLRSPMQLIQLLRAPLSRSPIGSVVSIASSAGLGSGAYGCPEYAAAKAGLIRLTTSLADWVTRFDVSVSCVVPGWIALPRAVQQVAAMPAAQRPSLVSPDAIADQVRVLVGDPNSAGLVVVMNEGEAAQT